MSIEITPLTGTIGALIGGVDLRTADESTIGAIRGALLEHRVVFFRDHAFAPEELKAFGRRFGPLSTHPIDPGIEGHPEVLVLDSIEQRRNSHYDPNVRHYKWHTDVTFDETPPMGSILNAVVIPERGGDTQWADLVAAYNTLSDPMRVFVDDLVAVHDPRPVFTEQAAKDPTGGWQERLASLTPTKHPVVRVHPETGERALFVNPAFTTRLDGFRPEESEPILGLLYEHIAQAEHVVRWHWREGDVAFWDNRATAHYVVTNYGLGHRRMQRVTVAGDRPYGPRDLTPESAVAV